MSEFIDKAVTAHSLWRSKLRDAINTGVVPDENTVGVDNLCDLGKWIYGEGVKYSSLPEYAEVKSLHQKFHQTAGATIRLIKSGKKPEALKSLDAGDFSQASNAVVLALGKLKRTNKLAA